MFVFYNQSQALEAVILNDLSETLHLQVVNSTDISATYRSEDGRTLQITHLAPWLIVTVSHSDDIFDCISLKPSNYIKPIRHRQVTLQSYDDLERQVYPALRPLMRKLHLRISSPGALLTSLKTEAMHLVLTFLDLRSLARLFLSCRCLSLFDNPSFWRSYYLASHSMPLFSQHLISWKKLALKPR
mmetsp:Transcript_28316/g.50481  ORF Transcript_28316/g.50481 Transcript_28316/m.50481 type:complete len:186 (-) Transcript_28316:803-1360(-)